MQFATALKLYLLDLKVAGVTSKHINEVRRIIAAMGEWMNKEGVTDVEQVMPVHIKSYQVFLQEMTIAADDIRVTLRGKRVSPQTSLTYMRRVRAFFAWCEREGYLTGPNPTIRVPKIKPPEFVIPSFSADQLAAMLDSVDTSTPGGFRDSTILLVLIDTGMRVSELCGLTMTSFKDDYLVVFGKGSRQREVGIGPTTLRSLLKYIHQYRKPFSAEEQHIFLSLTGHALLKSDIRQIVLKAAKAAGIEGVRASPHTVRHTFAQEWLNKGGDLASVSRLLGHSKIQTTENYLKGFQSREARQHHQHFSPVETNKLGRQISKSKRGRRKRDDD